MSHADYVRRSCTSWSPAIGLPRNRLQRGITLLELLIVLVIIAVIAAIAIPNYQDYVSRSRRADAMIALQQIANEQEQFYFDNNTYTTSVANLNLNVVSPDGYYNLSIPTADVNTFIARALPIGGTSQAGEGRFELRSTGAKGWDPDEDGTYECNWDDATRGKNC